MAESGGTPLGRFAINYASEARSSPENNTFNPLFTAWTVQKHSSAGTGAAATSTCLRAKTRWREDGGGGGRRHLAEAAATNLRGAQVSLWADFEKLVFSCEKVGKKTFLISAELNKTLPTYS